MATPGFRHFQNGLILSDPVDALIGEAWVKAVLCQREDGTQYWATPDLAKLPAVTEWRDATQEGQKPEGGIGEHPKGDEGWQATKASGRNRTRQSRKKPQATEG